MPSKMKRLARKTREALFILFWEIDYTAFEVFNGFTIFILGVSFWFLRSSQSIIAISTVDIGLNLVYAISVFMIIFGTFGMLSLTRRSVIMRKWAALVGVFIWGFLFTLFSTPPIKPTSIIFISVLTGFSIWAYIRLVLKHRGKRFLDPRDSYNNP